jgi:hypothetical protein
VSCPLFRAALFREANENCHRGEKDELPVVTREGLAKGLLRLPRVMLVVEKVRSLPAVFPLLSLLYSP